MRTDRNAIKIHMSTGSGPWCLVQGALYQPPKMTDHWHLVTCKRCIDKRDKTGAYAPRDRERSARSATPIYANVRSGHDQKV